MQGYPEEQDARDRGKKALERIKHDARCREFRRRTLARDKKLREVTYLLLALITLAAALVFLPGGVW